MTYAVVITGGRQCKVAVGQKILVDKLEVAPGQRVELDRVLLVSKEQEVRVGNPYVEGVKVIAESGEAVRGEKIRIVKFRRRKHYLRRKGHRQDYTQLTIQAIEGI